MAIGVIFDKDVAVTLKEQQTRDDDDERSERFYASRNASRCGCVRAFNPIHGMKLCVIRSLMNNEDLRRLTAPGVANERVAQLTVDARERTSSDGLIPSFFNQTFKICV